MQDAREVRIHHGRHRRRDRWGHGRPEVHDALIRRSSGQPAPELRCGALVVDPRGARVTVAGRPIKLTSHEFRVLSYLMHHRGRGVSQSELTEHIYAQSADRDSNTVEVFIARQRLESAGSSAEASSTALPHPESTWRTSVVLPT